MASFFQIALLFITLLIVTLIKYDDIVSSVLFQWTIAVELSAHLTVSYLVVPLLVNTQEIHHGTYIASHGVGHDASESH